MPCQHPLDGRGPEVFAVDPQPVAEPAGEIRVTGFITVAKVAAVVYAAGHPLRVGLGVVVVALETPWAIDVSQLTDRTDRAGLAGVDVDDLDPVGQRPQCAVRGVRCATDGDPALGRPESVDDPAAEPGGETVDVGGRAPPSLQRPPRSVGGGRALGGG